RRRCWEPSPKAHPCRGTTPPPSHPRDLERDLLCHSERVRLAAAPTRVPTLADRLSLLPNLAPGWHLGIPEHGPAGAAPHHDRAERPSQGGPSPTASRSAPPVSAVSAATMAPSASTAASGICWSIPVVLSPDTAPSQRPFPWGRYSCPGSSTGPINSRTLP